MDIWEEMYKKARMVQNGREISPFIEAGGVAAAILTKKVMFMLVFVLTPRVL